MEEGRKSDKRMIQKERNIEIEKRIKRVRIKYVRITNRKREDISN